jgi:hypothetical protein
VTGCACQLFVLAFQRIGRDLCVVERLDLERVREVASVTLALRGSKTKLSGVNVAMASRTLARRTSIRRTPPTRAILRRWGVAAVTGGLRMSAGQRPSAMVDAGRLPPALRVTVRAAPISHLVCELIAVGIVMTIRTRRGGQLEAGARPLAFVAVVAWNCLVPPEQGKLGSRVLLNGEKCRPEAVLVVAARTVGAAERAAMRVSVAIAAALESQLPISPRRRELGRMTALARNAAVQAHERELRLRVRLQSNVAR